MEFETKSMDFLYSIALNSIGLFYIVDPLPMPDLWYHAVVIWKTAVHWAM